MRPDKIVINKVKVRDVSEISEMIFRPDEREDKVRGARLPAVGSLGEAIRLARMNRRMTQRELGLALKFNESSADVRIAQYEAGSRSPRAELLAKIEKVLNCKFNKVEYVECVLFE